MSTKPAPINEWANAEHALSYLARADQVPHRTEGETTLLELVPRSARRILDLGTGDGRLLALLLIDRPDAEAVALDFSPAMLRAARQRFSENPRVSVVEHNLDNPLPDLGQFDAIVSSFAIHHCDDARKHGIYAEAFERLVPGGAFCNLEHVASPTPEVARTVSERTGHNARNRRSIKQAAGHAHAAGLVAYTGLRPCRLLLEVARTGAAGRLQARAVICLAA